MCCIRFDRFRIGVLASLTSLCLCFPVYAEDEAYIFDSEITEFTYLQNNELKLNQVENNIIQDEIQTQEEITAILSEPLADPTPLLNSSDSDSLSDDFGIQSVYVTDTGNASAPIRINFEFLGSRPENLFVLRTLPDYDVSGFFALSGNYVDARVPFILRGVYTSRSTDGYNYFPGEYTFDSTSIGESVNNPLHISDLLLSIVSDMLSWFIASFTVLTTWILGDSMAAVYAAIFLVGCAVAMLFRVLRSA